MSKYVYFRNDDVNSLDKQLIEITDIFISCGIPIIHAVEPANVRDDTVAWLNRKKDEFPGLIEIMQHGFDHRKREKGEFGGKRPYEDQLRDLSEGKRIMREKFGPRFINAVNFPFGPYNQGTIRAVNDLDFDILSSHYNYRISRRLMYLLGNALGKGQICGKHVAHHMRFYPGTRVFEIDMCLSFIKEYIGGYHSTDCVFQGIDEIFRSYEEFKKHTGVIGFLLHHRYHKDQKSIGLIEETIRRLKSDSETEFTGYSELYRRFAQ